MNNIEKFAAIIEIEMFQEFQVKQQLQEQISNVYHEWDRVEFDKDIILAKIHSLEFFIRKKAVFRRFQGNFQHLNQIVLPTKKISK